MDQALPGTSTLMICCPFPVLPPSLPLGFAYKNSLNLGFPDSPGGKEPACAVGDPGSIPGLGRSPGEGKGYPLQYSGLENYMDSPWSWKEADTT